MVRPIVFWSQTDSLGRLNSFIADLRVSAADFVTVSWWAIATAAYTLEYRDDLTTGDWLQLDVAIEFQDGWARAVDILPPGVTARYYRVTLVD